MRASHRDLIEQALGFELYRRTRSSVFSRLSLIPISVAFLIASCICVAFSNVTWDTVTRTCQSIVNLKRRIKEGLK